ncbi:uncharacterized protein C2845_PM06G04800 [Panicum miliaceum]|uniref:TMPIT-like protein n=1 Tax=Panicum miliaceum TaxID=4540 RepID=A0A3L6R547_PANMI|nr:uncharacterized protein C2845_PM06G04800 [Panicum miliaceum]
MSRDGDARSLEAARELREAAAALVTRHAAAEDVLRRRAAALEADLRRLQGSLAGLDPSTVDKVEEDLGRAKVAITDSDVASFLPSKRNGKFLMKFIGPVNVRVARKEDRLKIKDEYNNYRAWLLFLYTSFALRENVLIVNGSDIRPWWIYHHYLAMVMTLVSLTWEIKGQPDCSSKQKGVQLFLRWAIMQGIAMHLQNRYQRQRLRTRIALGKAKRMDVVAGETAGVEGQLLLLYPVLFVLQVVVCGILLVVMAVGNFVNATETLILKLRFKAKMKRAKSRQDHPHQN